MSEIKISDTALKQIGYTREEISKDIHDPSMINYEMFEVDEEEE